MHQPTPIRVLVNHKLEDFSEKFSAELLNSNVQAGESHRVLDLAQVSEQLIPAMLEQAKEFAAARQKVLLDDALSSMHEHQEAAINRLQALAKVNPAVSPEEIALLQERREQLQHAISHTSLRLDAVRFVWKGSQNYFG